jgi:hypothetical protein
MRLASAIYALVKGAAYRGNVDDSTRAQFDAIEWLDPRPKPTWDEVAAAMASDIRIDVELLLDELDAAGRLDELDRVLQRGKVRRRMAWQRAAEFAPQDEALLGALGELSWAPGELEAMLARCRTGST